jgi:hypothetical protein
LRAAIATTSPVGDAVTASGSLPTSTVATARAVAASTNVIDALSSFRHDERPPVGEDRERLWVLACREHRDGRALRGVDHADALGKLVVGEPARARNGLAGDRDEDPLARGVEVDAARPLAELHSSDRLVHGGSITVRSPDPSFVT